MLKYTLTNLINKSGNVLIIGASGSGKTMLLQDMLNTVPDRSNTKIIYVMTRTDNIVLNNSILYFSYFEKFSAIKQIHELAESCKEGNSTFKKTVLIIDDLPELLQGNNKVIYDIERLFKNSGFKLIITARLEYLVPSSLLDKFSVYVCFRQTEPVRCKYFEQKFGISCTKLLFLDNGEFYLFKSSAGKLASYLNHKRLLSLKLDSLFD